MKITLVSKNPPGGRCTLYGSYARVIAEALNGAVEIVFPEPEAALQPPALLIDGLNLEPADGLMLTPSELQEGLGCVTPPGLLKRLEEAEAEFMKECGA
ncbi:MAG: hypothetical protein HQL45_03500 [Alphaproteobacteria bacterium]|nr:hypothetical protein [Alphaproteobacteria bacterium]